MARSSEAVRSTSHGKLNVYGFSIGKALTEFMLGDSEST